MNQKNKKKFFCFFTINAFKIKIFNLQILKKKIFAFMSTFPKVNNLLEQ